MYAHPVRERRWGLICRSIYSYYRSENSQVGYQRKKCGKRPQQSGEIVSCHPHPYTSALERVSYIQVQGRKGKLIEEYWSPAMGRMCVRERARGGGTLIRDCPITARPVVYTSHALIKKKEGEHSKKKSKVCKREGRNCASLPHKSIIYDIHIYTRLPVQICVYIQSLPCALATRVH